MFEQILQVLFFVFMGLLGGITYVIVNSDDKGDLFTYNAYRRYLLGIVSGFVYHLLYSDYNFPNSVMCFVSGYMGTTFIEGLIEKLGSGSETDPS